MTRRTLSFILLALPAFVLAAWLVVSQIPRWGAPQINWFPAETPGACAAVSSLALVQGNRWAVMGMGPRAAQAVAAQVLEQHYGAPASSISLPLAVQATLPGEPRQAYYVVTARVGQAAAVLYLRMGDGSVGTLITTPTATDTNCAFDLRGAALAALRSTPLVLLVVYSSFAIVVLVVSFVRSRIRAKGKLR